MIKMQHREFQPGDQVLVLLPTSTSKSLAQWQDPYKVVKCVGEVDTTEGERGEFFM